MPRGQAHPPELRAKILADLLTGNSVRYVGKKHKLSTKTVAQWRDEAGIKPQVPPLFVCLA